MRRTCGAKNRGCTRWRSKYLAGLRRHAVFSSEEEKEDLAVDAQKPLKGSEHVFPDASTFVEAEWGFQSEMNSNEAQIGLVNANQLTSLRFWSCVQSCKAESSQRRARRQEKSELRLFSMRQIEKIEICDRFDYRLRTCELFF